MHTGLVPSGEKALDRRLSDSAESSGCKWEHWHDIWVCLVPKPSLPVSPGFLSGDPRKLKVRKS